MGENGLKLHQKKLRLDIRKNFITEGMVEPWNRMPRKVVKSYLKVFKRCVGVGVALGDMVWW